MFESVFLILIVLTGAVFYYLSSINRELKLLNQLIENKFKLYSEDIEKLGHLSYLGFIHENTKNIAEKIVGKGIDIFSDKK